MGQTYSMHTIRWFHRNLKRCLLWAQIPYTKEKKKILAEMNTAKNTVHHRHKYIHSIRIRIFFFLCGAETLRLICIRLHTHRIYWTTKHIHTPFIRTNTKERNLFGSCWFLFNYVSLSLYLSPLVCCFWSLFSKIFFCSKHWKWETGLFSYSTLLNTILNVFVV